MSSVAPTGPSEVGSSAPGHARLAGLLGIAVALSSLWAISSVADAIPFPPLALADRVVRWTPGGVATFFIELLGRWAIRGLAIGAVAGTVILGTELPLRIGRKDRPRFGVAAAVVGAAGIAASFSSGASDVSAGPAVVIVGLGTVLYGTVAAAVYRASTGPRGAPEVDLARRRILRAGVGGALGVAFAASAVGWFARKLSGPNRNVAIARARAPAVVPERAPFPDVPGLSPEITSAEDHYVIDINLFKPRVEVDGWELEVKGLVDNPRAYAFDDLQRSFEFVEQFAVLVCVSNEVGGPLIGHSKWGGVRLRDVLEAAGTPPGAIDVVFRAADGYSDSIPLEAAMGEDVLLAVAQNKQPLTQDHGFPCRVRVPSIYGMKNVKWLESIEVVPRDFKGYWQRRGWSDVARIKTESRIDVAGDDFTARIGEPAWIAGIAWAGDRGISKVEVSVDGARTWQKAMLKEPISHLSWTMWAYRWVPAQRGPIRVAVRATDGTGQTQTPKFSDPHPDGASGYHLVQVDVT